MITVERPTVNESFVSTNLATLIVQAEQKVILIEDDMSRGYSHKLFNLYAEQGTSCNIIAL